MPTSPPLAALLLLALATPAHAACPPATAGPTANWAAAVCEQRHETDDPLHPGVQQCLKALTKADRIPPAPAEACPLNLKYKTELCRARVKLGRDKSVPVCVDAVDTVPPQVSHGVGD